MTHPSPSTPSSSRRRWWIAPSVLVLGLYAGFFAFAVAQACPNYFVTPLLDCVVNNNNGSYTAWFGYNNTKGDITVLFDTYKTPRYNQVIDTATGKQVPLTNVFLPGNVQMPANYNFDFAANKQVDFALGVTFTSHDNPSGVTWNEAESNLQAKSSDLKACGDNILITPNPATSTVGQPITFTAPVTPKTNVLAGVKAPPFTGNVLFTDENNKALGSTVPLTSNYVETLTTSSLSVGTHTIKATYSGNSVYPLTSATTTVLVKSASVCSIAVSTGTTALLGQPVTFTGNFTGGPSNVSNATVTFTDTPSSGTAIQPGTSTLVNGSAQFLTSKLSLGKHTITVSYAGDSGNNPASCSVPLTVNPIPTTTTVVSSQNPTVQGQGVTFTATVAPVAPNTCTLTGQVTFTIIGANPATYQVNVSGGQATTPTITLSQLGANAVTAVYSGDATCLTSTGTTTQTIGNVSSPPSGSNNSFFRIAQAANNSLAVDVAIDSATNFPNLSACTVGGYYPLSAGSHIISISANGKTLYSHAITFTAGDYYTLGFVDDTSATPALAPNLVVFQDDLSVAPGNAKSRVYHLSDSAGSVAVTANGAIVVTTLSFENASSYLAQTPGVENYTITPFNTSAKTENVSINEAANQVYSLFLMCGADAQTTAIGGIPTALPQTGFAPTPSVDWNAIAFFMGALAVIGAGLGGVTGLAVVQYRRRHR